MTERIVKLTCLLLILTSFGQVYAGQVYDRVIKTGVVKIGVPYNLIPQGFSGSSGELVGFEVDLAEQLARHMNLKLETFKINDKTWKDLLSKGTLDAAFCRITHSRHLENVYDFSEPYFFNGLYLITARGSIINPSELKGMKLAVLQGSSAEKTAMKLLRSAGDMNSEKNVYSYPDRPSCFLALSRDKVDAWLDSGMLLLEYAAKTPGKYELLAASDNFEPISIALPQDDSAWRDLINFSLLDIMADGTYAKIYDKWFGPDTSFVFPLRRHLDLWPE